MFKYTDLAKHQNYIGFESGIVCFYPIYSDMAIIDMNPEYCEDFTDFEEIYNEVKPKYYDPRCRSWYKS